MSTINLSNLLKMPLVKQALQQEMARADDNERIKRLTILDELNDIEADWAKADAKVEAARKKFEEANSAMQVERGKLGAAEQQRSQISMRREHLLRDLRNFGERAVMDAANRINGAYKGVEREIEILQNAKNGRDAEGNARRAERLAELIEWLPILGDASSAIEQLRLARLSPQEVADQATAILSSAGIDDEAEAA